MNRTDLKAYVDAEGVRCIEVVSGTPPPEGWEIWDARCYKCMTPYTTLTGS